MDIVEATDRYEGWLSGYMELRDAALERKHEDMAADEFLFLRATYYRWAQVFPVICAQIASTAPRLLSVGDLHVENFGTWRDAEGRLVWGVNDFDEAAKLPYVNDLVRLGLSAKWALTKCETDSRIEWHTACEAIAEGYRDALSDAAEDIDLVKPIVLAESHGWLARIASDQAIDPEKFWAKLESQLEDDAPDGSRIACAILRSHLPSGCGRIRWKERTAGEGSLGRPRVVAVTEWHGARLAREAKAMAPSAALWAKESASKRIRYAKILDRARRSPDPFVHLVAASDGDWIVRRLAPDCCRIEIETLGGTMDEKLMHAMGHETANIHLGQPDRALEALDHLDGLGPSCEWLHDAVAAMETAMREDQKAWNGYWHGRVPVHKSEVDPVLERG
jgi:Ser/Thr protein kinase RdoA (MazF antagonist)